MTMNYDQSAYNPMGDYSSQPYTQQGATDMFSGLLNQGGDAGSLIQQLQGFMNSNIDPNSILSNQGGNVSVVDPTYSIQGGLMPGYGGMGGDERDMLQTYGIQGGLMGGMGGYDEDPGFDGSMPMGGMQGGDPMAQAPGGFASAMSGGPGMMGGAMGQSQGGPISQMMRQGAMQGGGAGSQFFGGNPDPGFSDPGQQEQVIMMMMRLLGMAPGQMGGNRGQQGGMPQRGLGPQRPPQARSMSFGR